MSLGRRPLVLGALALAACPSGQHGEARPEAAGAPARAAAGAPGDEAIVDLWLAGDLHLGEGGPEVLAGLAALVPAGAIGVVNLEGPIGAPPAAGARNGRGGPALSNSPRVPAILGALGVAAVGVANNHADDLGAGGQARTREALRGAGLQPAGDDEAAIVARAGLRIAVSAHFLDPAPPPSLAASLRRARGRADHLIATFHVDGPPSYLPPAGLRAAVEVALAAGAAAIVAHGSHALARVERRGDAVIAWGLGNLAFACRCTDEVDGAILALRLDRRRIVDAAWIPIAAGLAGEAVAPSPDPQLLFDLMRALGSSPGVVEGGHYRLALAP